MKREQDGGERTNTPPPWRQSLFAERNGPMALEKSFPVLVGSGVCVGGEGGLWTTDSRTRLKLHSSWKGTLTPPSKLHDDGREGNLVPGTLLRKLSRTIGLP